MLLAPSVEVAVTVNWKSTSESAGGVTFRVDRLARSSPDIVHVPSPLSKPSDRVAPLGTPEIDTLSSSAKRLSTDAERSSAMAVSSSPVGAATVRVGMLSMDTD